MNKSLIRVQWLIAILLWIYIFYRAVSIGITQDEAYSYFLVKTDYWRAMPGSLNTHWLNTLGMRLFLWLPGEDAVWKLRMFSVLSWWLYAFSAIKLSSLFTNKTIGFTFFLASVLNPFLLFYFSLGRGYAAACAFILFCLWQASQRIQLKQGEPLHWVKVFLPAALAVCSNFSSFYFFIGLSSTYLLHLFVSGKVRSLFRRSAITLWLLTAGTTLFATASLLFIKYHTKDFEGSQTAGFIYSLFSSQIGYGLHFGAGINLLPPGSLLFTLLVVFAVIAGCRYARSRDLTIGIYSLFVVAIIVLCNALFYLLFRTPFVYGRTGLVLFVASLPAFFLMADSWSPEWTLLKAAILSLMLLIGTGFIFNFYKAFNTRYFAEFPFQADTEKSLDSLGQWHAHRVGLTLWHYSVFVNYYSKAFPGKYQFKAELVDENGPHPFVNDNDHMIITMNERGRDSLLNHWTVKWENQATQTMVLEKK